MLGLLFFHLLMGTAAASDDGTKVLRQFGDYTLVREAPERLPGAGSGSRLVDKPTELKVVPSSMKLRHVDGTSISSTFVQGMRKASRGGVSRAVAGSTGLLAVEGGNVHLADVTVGGQEFAVVIDTGSADPWLAPTDFRCFDVESGTQVEEATCEFGPLYNRSRSTTYRPITNQNFNISYADGEYLYGSLGTETMEMAGIVVTNQTFATVDVAAWYGDLTSSGLFGFAYRSLTSAYRGATGKNTGRVLYNPIFVNMYTNSGVAPVFAIALDRDISAGGVISLGGVPNVPTGRYQARTRVIPAQVNGPGGLPVYEFYTIDIDGFAISDRQNARFTSAVPNLNPARTPLQSPQTDVIVDSGTTLIYAPNTVAVAVAAAFSPAAYYDPDYDIHRVDCGAKAPVFGVSIGGKVFFVNPLDLIVNLGQDENGVGFCVMGVQGSGEGLSILGGVFMKNVLSVFDVGSQEMRFSARQFYNLSR
ncbi:hypothetical protein TI39_contig475g00016 [Zymoseptoria brevis]|uniref:Peptidase A1 domain-containing protein n=1 Tax=Zymoseptoria brevis TaxID=1047168 RepID=A0A0F4GK81_9PEZI|nr:hypothetical protein TI39_contig475g00016 [Zymoseptoria brevis]